MPKLKFSCKSRRGSSEQPSTFLRVRQRANNFFSRRKPRPVQEPEADILQSGARASSDSARGPVNHTIAGGQDQRSANANTGSSDESFMLSLWDSEWTSESSEYVEHVSTNTLDAKLGRQLQVLQTLMCNPDLSPGVRSILAAAWRQFEKQSARTRETLPAYSMDGKPPPYQTNARD